MNHMLGVMSVIVFVILCTSGFGYAVQTGVTEGNFPFFQIGCIFLGGLIISSIKARYRGFYTSEAIGCVALYTILISLFTEPVINTIKALVS
jgi:hypothetical protein